MANVLSAIDQNDTEEKSQGQLVLEEVLMKISKLIVVVLWLWIVVSSVAQGFDLPTSELARQLSSNLSIGYWMIALPVVIVIGSLYCRQLPGGATLGKLVDGRYGRGTYLSFLKQLKLELLFSSMAFSIGVIGLLRSLSLGGPRGGFIISSFFLSGGVAFLVAYFVMRRRALYTEHQ